MACNEKEQDDVSPSAIKNALHQERIVVEKKGIDGFQADNLSLIFIFSNRKDGGVWLDRSDADRRMSLIYVPKQEPRLTLRHHIAQRFGLSESEAYKWLKEVALPVYASKHEVAKWLGHLFLTCDLSTQPTAFHGASYDDVMERQKPFFEQFCEAVFLDRMIDGKQYTFDYINETIAYAGYAALCKSLNNGRGIMGIRTFRPDLRDWLAEHAPHIVRKEKWQGYNREDHVRLWFNTRLLEKLRLEDSNDTKYPNWRSRTRSLGRSIGLMPVAVVLRWASGGAETKLFQHVMPSATGTTAPLLKKMICMCHPACTSPRIRITQAVRCSGGGWRCHEGSQNANGRSAMTYGRAITGRLAAAGGRRQAADVGPQAKHGAVTLMPAQLSKRMPKLGRIGLNRPLQASAAGLTGPRRPETSSASAPMLCGTASMECKSNLPMLMLRYRRRSHPRHAPSGPSGTRSR